MPLPERIASGTLTTADRVTAYEVPQQTRVVLASVVFVNTAAVVVNVGAWVTVGKARGSPMRFPVMPPQLELGAGDSYHMVTPVAIEPNESLEVQASGSGIWYYVTAYRQGVLPSPSDRAE